MSPKKSVQVVWFRRDLRLHDNPAFFEAVKHGDVLPVYLVDEDTPALQKRGAASNVWLHHGLTSLKSSLHGILNIYKGTLKETLTQLHKRFDLQHVHTNTAGEPWMQEQDKTLNRWCDDHDIACTVHHGNYLFAPPHALKDDGTPYRVFSAYKRHVLQKHCRKPLPIPKEFHVTRDDKGQAIEDLNLLASKNLSWDSDMMGHWDASEKGAHKTLEDFLNEGIFGYKEKRDYPSKPHVSTLSPYLHFGHISPFQVYDAVQKCDGPKKDVDHFISELIWREFSNDLAYHFPSIDHANIQSKFDHFPWKNNASYLEKWQKGQTGYPLIDAGMRQLWSEGYLHNRMRMVVASFLIKNLMIHWHKGHQWFWDCLVDADFANNSASWQWAAGSGMDAAPYFRIFNPLTQSEKFDEDGAYIKTYVPELKDMPAKYIHAPWKAPEDVLKDAGVKLGTNYPKPMIDLYKSRDHALQAFKELPKS